MRTWLSAFVGSCVCLVAGAASAHHAFAVFDVTREMTVHGVVRDFEWSNPHVWVDVTVRDPEGRDMNWAVVAASPNALRRFGWTRGSMKPGDQIEAVIHPRKDGLTGGSLVTITVNGQALGIVAPKT